MIRNTGNEDELSEKIFSDPNEIIASASFERFKIEKKFTARVNKIYVRENVVYL